MRFGSVLGTQGLLQWIRGCSGAPGGGGQGRGGGGEAPHAKLEVLTPQQTEHPFCNVGALLLTLGVSSSTRAHSGGRKRAPGGHKQTCHYCLAGEVSFINIQPCTMCHPVISAVAPGAQ